MLNRTSKRQEYYLGDSVRCHHCFRGAEHNRQQHNEHLARWCETHQRWCGGHQQESNRGQKKAQVVVA